MKSNIEILVAQIIILKIFWFKNLKIEKNKITETTHKIPCVNHYNSQSII